MTNLIIETKPDIIPTDISTAYSHSGAPHLETKSQAMANISAAGISRVKIACAIIFITYIALTNLLYTFKSSLLMVTHYASKSNILRIS